MRHSVVLVVLAAAALLAAPASVAARQATPIASPGAATALDLALTVPAPDDLPEPGFGRMNDTTWLLDGVIPGTALYLGLDAAELADTLTAAGFGRMYESFLGRPVTPGDHESPPAEIVRFYVAEYASAGGTATAFDLLEDEHAVPTARDDPGAATIGDRSEATRDASPWDFNGTPLRQRNVDLSFLLGNLYAGVTLYDFGSSEPSLATVEALAELLRERIEAVQAAGAAGLGIRALRVADPNALAGRDGYMRLDGRGVPFYGDLLEDVEAFQRTALEPAVAVYSVEKGIAGVIPDVIGQVQVRLYRFASAEAAATSRVQGFSGPLLYTPGRAFNVRWVDEVAALGDETRAYSYQSERPQFASAQPSRGFVVYVRLGAEAFVVDLERVMDLTRCRRTF